MRKILMISAMAILTIATTKAQEVRFGVKGGLNLANLSLSQKSGGTTTTLDTSFRPSFYVGGLAEFVLADNFFVEAGLQYANNGTKFSIEESGMKVEASISLNQLNIPVMAKYAVIDGLMLKGGAYAGYLMSGSITGKTTISGVSKEETQDVEFKEDGLNRIDFGLSAGIEYSLPQGIFFEAGYNFGLKDFDNSDDSTYTRGIQVGVGYKF